MKRITVKQLRDALARYGDDVVIQVDVEEYKYGMYITKLSMGDGLGSVKGLNDAGGIVMRVESGK